MSTGRPPAPQQVPISLEPAEGWHCSHFYYRFDRGVLAQLSAEELRSGREQLISILDPAGSDAPQRLSAHTRRHLVSELVAIDQPVRLRIGTYEGRGQEHRDFECSNSQC